MSRIRYRLSQWRASRRDFRRRRGEEGFTLIELMVVVLIMGILAAIAIPTFLGAKSGAQNAAVQSNLRNLLTDQATALTNTGAYAGKAALAALDPTYKTDLTATTPVISDTAGSTSSGAPFACMYEKSASGSVYAIGTIANGSAAGTYYYSSSAGTDPGCTGKFGTGWSQTAATAGW